MDCNNQSGGISIRSLFNGFIKTIVKSKRHINILSFITTAALVMALVVPTTVSADHDPFGGQVFEQGDNIPICHATGPNGFNFLNPGPSLSGSGGNPSLQGHEGGHGQNTDIIPPFHYDLGNGTESYPGVGWSDDFGGFTGEAIWNNDCDIPNDESATGSLTVIKETIGGDDTFGFTGTSPIDDFSITTENLTGSQTFSELPPNFYVITENSLPDGWTQTNNTCDDNDGGITVPAGQGVTCTITNTFTPPEEQVATIVATKIVCDSVDDLPKWGNGGPDITATTATDWLSDHQGCHLQDGWNFQWGPENAYDPGDTLVGPATAPWVEFGPTVSGVATTTLTAEDLGNNSYLWMREELKDGYIPFTFDSNGDTNIDPNSAEMYAGTDVLNYDNRDRVDDIQVGQTYYVVAWNVEETCDASTNLMTDGSFETPTVTNPALWDIFAGDGITVPGWLAEWLPGSGGGHDPQIELQNGVNGWLAQDGTQYTEMDSDWFGPNDPTNGEAASVKISQTLTTMPGKDYIISFYTSPRPGLGAADNAIEFFWNGGSQGIVNNVDGTGNPNTAWTQHTYTLTATGASTIIAFADAGTPADSLGGFLDNVSVIRDCGQEPPEENTYTISGYKFNDLNHNGVWDGDSDEAGLAGWTIFIDYNNDGILDGDEPSTITGPDGSYSFNGLANGPYIIAEVMQAGWIQTTPGGVDEHHSITIEGQNVTELDFGNYHNNCDFTDEQTGWYGKYYDYSATHPGMNIDPSLWPDATHGDPLSNVTPWTADWYDSSYLVQTQVDPNLNFPGQFFPLDGLGADDPTGNTTHNYHFGAHWSGQVNITTPNSYGYSITSDDDSWVYVDGVLETDNAGIHAAVTVNDSVSLTAGEHVFDIFFAERHTVASQMNFLFDNPDLVVTPFSYNCEQPNEPHTNVTGMKFVDYNSDGIKNGDDHGLQDWTIYAAQEVGSFDVDSNGDVTGTPTNSPVLDNGTDYLVRVGGTFDAGDSITADAKYSVRLPNTTWTDLVQNYEIYGPTLLDLQLDGVSPDWGTYNSGHVYWHTITGTGVPVSFQINDIFASNNVGMLSVTLYKVLASTLTDINGNYSFDLTGIDGNIIIAEQTQDGWIQTAPSPLGYYTVAGGSEVGGQDFGNHQIPPPQEFGSITGKKIHDHDSDGIQDEGDENLSGWTIYLDLNNNGVKDTGEPSTVTAGDGSYSFSDLAAGTYIVREVGQDGWSQAFPHDGAAYSLPVGNGEGAQWDWTDIIFGNITNLEHQGDTGNGGGGGGGGGGSYTPPTNEEVRGDQSSTPDLALTDPGNDGSGGDVLGDQDLPVTGTPIMAYVVVLLAIIGMLGYRKSETTD